MSSDPQPVLPRLLLAMDTSGDVCSVALLKGGQLGAEIAFRHEMHLSERLIAHLDLLLGEVGAKLPDVDCFVAGVGPGSFTGTRIGVMTVKTFAYVQDRPIVAINGLEAMAAEYSGVAGISVTPILACRAGVVYACPYSGEGDSPVAQAKPDAYTFAELGGLIGRCPGTPLFCGPAAQRYAHELRECLGARGAAARIGTVEFPRASTLGRLALQRLAAGEAPVAPLDVVPLYISPPPITLSKSPIPVA